MRRCLPCCTSKHAGPEAITIKSGNGNKQTKGALTSATKMGASIMGIRQGLVAICLIAGLAACTQTETSSGGDTARTPTGAGATDTLNEKTADDLARKYIQCVNAAGFKLEHVSVHHFAGTGIMVKTAVDVPAPVHAPCLESIGGASTDRSSWGL